MKTFWIIAFCVLLIGSFFWRKTASQLREAREENARLLAQASAGNRLSPRMRSERDAKRGRWETGERSFATAIRFAKKIDASGERVDSAEVMDWVKLLSSLREEEVLKLLSALQEDAGISTRTRGYLSRIGLIAIAKERPEVALRLAEKLVPDSGGGNSDYGLEMIALHKWAETDSQAALAWILEKGNRNPAWKNATEAKHAVLSTIAQKDPAAAFLAMEQLGMKPEAALSSIAGAGADHPAQRTATLEALRGYLAKLPTEERADATTSALSAMAGNLGKEDFASVTSWIHNAKFSPSEIEAFAEGLDYYQTKNDTGQWIDWLGKQLTAEQLSSSVNSLMSDWTHQDYQTAGQWLANAPPGLAKEEAVCAYAGAVAEYDLPVAIQWAGTLPENRRQQALQAIYDNWPEADKTSAENFAKQHNLKTDENEKE